MVPAWYQIAAIARWHRGVALLRPHEEVLHERARDQLPIPNSQLTHLQKEKV